VFLPEKLYQVDQIDNILMSRVFSGVSLYWSSNQTGHPYPYFYRGAGSIFLHNAVQAKLKLINGQKKIFLAAEDELLEYTLTSKDPYVSCFSSSEVVESYELTYYMPCQEKSLRTSVKI
jgi:hypothetical protein